MSHRDFLFYEHDVGNNACLYCPIEYRDRLTHRVQPTSVAVRLKLYCPLEFPGIIAFLCFQVSCVCSPTYMAVWRIAAHFAPPGEIYFTRYGRISERRGAPCKKCTGWLLRQCLSSWYLLITCFHFCRPVVLTSSCIAQFCFPEVAFSKILFFFFFPHTH